MRRIAAVLCQRRGLPQMALPQGTAGNQFVTICSCSVLRRRFILQQPLHFLIYNYCVLSSAPIFLPSFFITWLAVFSISCEVSVFSSEPMVRRMVTDFLPCGICFPLYSSTKDASLSSVAAFFLPMIVSYMSCHTAPESKSMEMS